MKESCESNIVPEQSVIEALDRDGIEDPLAKELLSKYVDQCNDEANAEAAADPESSIVSNRANIKAAMKVAILYCRTEKYMDYARKSLMEAWDAASQDESTQDLAEQIEDLLLSLGIEE